MKIPRYRDIIPPVEEAYLSIDGAMVAIASVVVALLQRTWPDEDKRELELERMRLENEKIKAEIDVLRQVEVVADGGDGDGDEADGLNT